MTGIPVVDAPCNGRAHPLGIMGSLGLHRYPRHVTTTAAVGGPGRGSRSLELLLRANAQEASDIVRAAVDRAGVPAAVVRNPVPASYVRKHAAPGALRYAQEVGEVMRRLSESGADVLLNRLAAKMQGETLVRDGL